MLDLWTFLDPAGAAQPVPVVPHGVTPAGAALFLAAFTLPGLALLLAMPRPPRALSYLLAGAAAVSTGWVLLASLVLLRAGRFDRDALLIAAAVPFAVALVRLPAVVRSIGRLRLDTRCLMPGLFTAALFAALVLTTPTYGAFSALGMDAANYELYGSHFARTGSLYLDLAPYAERGLPTGWVAFRNNWALSGDGAAMPFYVHGYPALLGAAKTLLGSAYGSWVVNAWLGMLVAGLLGGMAARLSRSAWLGAGLGAVAVLCPLMLQYAKITMSEMTALAGFLTVTLALLEQDRRRSAANIALLAFGWVLILFAKLDAFVLVAFFCLAVAFVAVNEFARGRRPLLGPGALVVLALVIGGSGVAVGLLTTPKYIGNFSIDAYERLTSIPFAIPYSIAAGLGLVVLAGLQRAAAGRPQRWLTWVTPAAVAGVALAWYAFIAWNLSLRPFGHILTDAPRDHQPVNLLRLFFVTPALPLAASVVLLPWAWARSPRSLQIVLLVCGAIIAMLIVNSRHSASLLWAMRRFLVTVLPLLTLVPALALGQMRRPRPAALWLGAFMGLAAFQAVQTAPFLAQVNAYGPAAGEARAEAAIAADDALVVLKGEPRMLSGMATSIRAMRGGLTLVTVPTTRLEDVTARLPENGRALLLAYRSAAYAAWHGLSPVHGGTYHYRLQGALSAIREQPRAAMASVPYTLYDLRRTPRQSLDLFNALQPGRLHPGVRTHDLDAGGPREGGAIALRATGNDPFLVLHTGPVPEGARAVVRVQLDAPRTLTCRLFYRTPEMNRFDEAASLVATAPAGTATLYFLLPAEAAAGPVRLDLGSETGPFVIRALGVRVAPDDGRMPATAWVTSD